MRKASNENADRVRMSKDIMDLSPEDKEKAERFIRGLNRGKNRWELITAYDLAAYLAANPKLIFEWSCVFFARFIYFLPLRLSDCINEKIEGAKKK